MHRHGKTAALLLLACASQLPAVATAAPATTPIQAKALARHDAPEVRTRDLLLFGAGLILLAGQRRPKPARWQPLDP